MPVRPMTYGESVVTWQAMADSVARRLEEMPQLRELHTGLQALIDRALALEAQRDQCNARLRAVNQERRTALAEGRDLRNRVAALLQGYLGLESERLLEFGVTPRKRNPRRRRKAHAEKTLEAQATPAAGPGDPPPVN